MKEFKRLPIGENKKPIHQITQNRLDWIKKNYSRFSSENELIDAMIDYNNHLFAKFNKEKARILLKVFYGEARNTSNNYVGKNKSIKTLGGEKNKCYMCKKICKTEKHHISYCPEKIILVCCSCHKKIHSVIGSYHEKEKVFLNYLTLNDKLIDFNKFCEDKETKRVASEKCDLEEKDLEIIYKEIGE
jgi:hypothetical protein